MIPILAQETTELSGSSAFILFLAIGGAYFALIVAAIVWRRRQKRWALWSALSFPVPIVSIVVPVLALKQGRPETVVFTEACPGCGEHTGWAEHARFDRESKQRLPHVIWAIISGVLGIAIGIGAILLAISIWRGGDRSCSGGVCLEWENGAFLAGIGFLGFGLWLAAWVGHWAMDYAGADKVDGTAYRCGGCDETWVRLDMEAVAAI
jgi:hypothetical protein